ncbi:hypothetical protein RYX36_017309 [Vicia faba]
MWCWVKKWLNKLHDIVFEAKDLFDEINTEELRRSAEANQICVRKVRNKVARTIGDADLLYNRHAECGCCSINMVNCWQNSPTSVEMLTTLVFI